LWREDKRTDARLKSPANWDSKIQITSIFAHWITLQLLVLVYFYYYRMFVSDIFNIRNNAKRSQFTTSEILIKKPQP